MRVQSSINRHVWGVSYERESHDVNFQPIDQYLYVKITTCNELTELLLRKFQIRKRKCLRIASGLFYLFNHFFQTLEIQVIWTCILTFSIRNTIKNTLALFAKEPGRLTSGSAGYDFYSAEYVIIQPH